MSQCQNSIGSQNGIENCLEAVSVSKLDSKPNQCKKSIEKRIGVKTRFKIKSESNLIKYRNNIETRMKIESVSKLAKIESVSKLNWKSNPCRNSISC